MHQLPVIEDSSLWPFSFEGQPCRPLYSQDEDNLTIHICSFSKWFFPSLRFAAALGRSPEFRQLRQVNRGITRITSAFPQFAVSHYMKSGRFASDLQASNVAYEKARNALFESLKRSCPNDASFQRPDAGFSIWVDLPLQVSSSQLYGQCMRLGVYP